MSDEQGVENLAQTLYEIDWPVTDYARCDWGPWEEVNENWRYDYKHIAKHLLNSDWLAAHDREVAAKAWDEGFADSINADLGDYENPPDIPENPYRNPEGNTK